MKKLNMLLAGILFLLSACKGELASASTIPTRMPTSIPPTGTAFIPSTKTAQPVYPPSPLPTLDLVFRGPGDVKIPILLYHHIDSVSDSIYRVAPADFEKQIKLLKEWGYTSITVEDLVQAIKVGKELPSHPILITFDDGNVDNYTNAFPIMQKYGFSGVLYLVVNYIGTDGYLSREQILEMIQAGWEVGNHSMDHPDVTKLTPEQQAYEIKLSKQKLEKLLGIKIRTFAYPFGTKDDEAINYVYHTGYVAAMGAEGYTADQGTWNLFNLQRVTISGLADIQSFVRFLPWHGDSNSLSVEEPLPTIPIPTNSSVGRIK
jgi:peptidoglycan/xylan/chitin deacetylase (PgdA/CDA1 family)